MTRRDLVLQTLLQTPLALFTLSCARPSPALLRPLLNSERIALVFGSYGLEVLESAGRLRVSSLYSLEGGRKVCRTFAVAELPAAIDPRLAAEHLEILSGASIGAVFKRAGFEVEKRHRYFGELAPDPRRQRLRRLMGGAGGRTLALHVYTMVLHRGGEAIDYATIAEIYHPAFLDLDDLAGIYGPDVAVHSRPEAAAGLLRLAEQAALR